MAVSAIQLGQLWKLNETGDTWLVTKVYSEAFSSYAMLRKGWRSAGENGHRDDQQNAKKFH